ncbi:hepcidin [Dicentrarchus labrax]|uniref:hepcidin-like n=1 Tax=Dicentrarchus labrax TaxID=13489 RepID=UPI001637AFF2|nr:hepcidin isoform X14 [Dicentrarchus labrax]XP_051261702.1 hepcidin-like [Dicentrarchus labrax]XP_051261703.1 hepcidin-like [Dicentrarchus labrax]XP_051261706.1 hepcidin [Dicentrarchus labrax]
MKTFSVAVAVAVVLAFICLQESSAVPVTEVQELEEPMSNEYQEMPVESWKMPYNNRHKRHSSPGGCRFCCGCCPNMSGCGVCCRF